MTFAEKALELGLIAFKEMPCSLAISYRCLANCQKEAGQRINARQSLQEALELYKEAGDQEGVDSVKKSIEEISMIE